jgi:hypothetical protein
VGYGFAPGVDSLARNQIRIGVSLNECQMVGREFANFEIPLSSFYLDCLPQPPGRAQFIDEEMID